MCQNGDGDGSRDACAPLPPQCAPCSRVLITAKAFPPLKPFQPQVIWKRSLPVHRSSSLLRTINTKLALPNCIIVTTTIQIVNVHWSASSVDRAIPLAVMMTVVFRFSDGSCFTRRKWALTYHVEKCATVGFHDCKLDRDATTFLLSCSVGGRKIVHMPGYKFL